MFNFDDLENQKRYFFIINPVSGNGKGKKIIPEIERLFGKLHLSYEIKVTEFAKQGIELAKKAIEENYDIIVAVGGDGTVNEVASAVVGTKATLGIIPIGSGNGLARELKIPLSSKAALQNLISGTRQIMDTGICNQHFFACTAGIGFDAYMAQKFLTLEKRGLVGYVKLFFREFYQYKEKKYELIVNENKITVDAFLITIANCRQWGNDFFISPKSIHNDGKLEICIIKKFSLIYIPALLYRLITKTIHKSRFFESYTCQKLEIISNNEKSMTHTDGECHEVDKNLLISINARSLKIIGG